jgi:hypothetical protein
MPTDVNIGEQMIDITAPEVVEILIRDDGKVVWINVDGICRFRACEIKALIAKDKRDVVDTETQDSDDEDAGIYSRLLKRE